MTTENEIVKYAKLIDNNTSTSFQTFVFTWHYHLKYKQYFFKLKHKAKRAIYFTIYNFLLLCDCGKLTERR